MYQYIIKTGNKMTIDTPFCKSKSDIKEEIISRSVDCTHMRMTYPNGFIIEIITFADKIVYETNRELIDNGNGHFTVSD